jgi:hypothetical protein
VEEGLRERRRARESSAAASEQENEDENRNMPSQLGIDLTYVTNPLANGEGTRDRNDPLIVEELRPEFQGQHPEDVDEGAYNYDPEKTAGEESPAPEPFRENESDQEIVPQPEISSSRRYIDVRYELSDENDFNLYVYRALS